MAHHCRRRAGQRPVCPRAQCGICFHAHVHDLRSQQDVGNEHFVSGELFADLVDAGEKAAVEDLLGADALINKYNPDVIGLSALLTTTMNEQGHIIQQLTDAGVRDKVKVMVGGAPVTQMGA